MGDVKRLGQRPWRPQLTAREQWLGLAFLGLYLLVFPFLRDFAVRGLAERRGLFVPALASYNVYYAAVLVLLIGIFWGFLRNGASIFLGNWRPSLFAFGAGFFAALALTCLAGAIPLPLENPQIMDYKSLIKLAPGSPWPVIGSLWLMNALLRPVTEEILYRGFLFGFFRKENRALAYAVSAGLFALAAVWQHALFSGNLAYLLLAVQYLPMGLVLCWVYDVSGSVYVPVALRVVLQTVFLMLACVAPGEPVPMGI